MCCSCSSVRSRFRCLKCSGALLITIGILYTAAGVAFNFFEFLVIFTTGHALIWAGGAIFVAGVSSIFITKKISDDDWSTRGAAFMCLLAVACALGNVAIHTFTLYEAEYFQAYSNATFMAQKLTYDLTHDLWLGVIIADASIDGLAALTTLAGLAAFGVGCCCSEYSEIVDNIKSGVI